MIGRAVRLVGHGRSRRSRFGITGWLSVLGAFFAWAAWSSGNPDTFRIALVVIVAAAVSGALRRGRRHGRRRRRY